MLNLIFKMQNLSDFSYFLLNIRKVLVNWNFFLTHFYASNFVNRLFLQRSLDDRFVGKAHATWVISSLFWLNKRSSEYGGRVCFSQTQISKFSDDLVLTCNLPPLPSGGRGRGRGWFCGLARIWFYLNLRSHLHPNLPPPDGGRDRLLLLQRVAWALPMR